MATATGKTRCTVCSKEKATIKCGGCGEDFCYKHWEPHRQELNKQLDEIEVNRDLFRQSLTQQTKQPNNHILIQQIEQWEQKSIRIIEQVAEEASKIVLKTTNENIHQLEERLNNLTIQLRQSREDDDVNEISLHQFQEELKRLTKELTKPRNISIREDSTSFINKIYVDVSGNSTTSIPNESVFKYNIDHNTRWRQNGVTVAGGNGEGNGLNQLSRPTSMYMDDDQTIYVVDDDNCRIMAWKSGASAGQIVAGGNGGGNKMNQLNEPTDVIIDKERNNLIICDENNRRVVRWPLHHGSTGQIIIADVDCCRLSMNKNGYLYVSDFEKHEVRRWKVGNTNGTLVAGGNGQGNGLNQLNGPTCIFVDEDHSIYVSDWDNHRVMKWMKGAKQGIIVAGGQGEGNGPTQLSHPQGLIVDHLGTIYVSDRDNHRIKRWFKRALQGDVIVGGNGKGEQANQLNYPLGLSFDRQGNLYVVDCLNHRIQRFDIDRS